MQPEIEETYIEPGQVKAELRPMAFLGAESVWAAEAAACANEEDRFLDYHDKLFEEQGAENSGAFAIDNLKAFALDLGLDTAAFNSCLDSHKYLEPVRRETEEAGDAGVESTPTFFVGDKKISGLKPFGELADIIEEELEKAS